MNPTQTNTTEAHHLAWLRNREAKAQQALKNCRHNFHCDSALMIGESGGCDAALFGDDEIVIAAFKLWLQEQRERYYSDMDERARQKAIEARRKSLKVV